MALSNTDREEIGQLIRTVVNGNIIRLEGKLDGHIEKHEEIYTELTAIVEAVQWINTSKRFITWFGGIAGGLAATWTLIRLGIEK